MSGEPGTRVAVVGSANLDIVVHVARFPGPGETLLGDALAEVAGGKGLNQALAAARSVPCAFIGRGTCVSNPAVVSSQLEVPLDCVVAAARWAGDHGARFVLNASPIRGLPPEVLAASDPQVVNRGEAAALLAGDDGDGDGAVAGVAPPTRDLAGRLSARVRSVVVAALSVGAPLREAAVLANAAAGRIVTVPRGRR